MSKTKLKILTPTGVIIKDLEIALGEYTSDFRILVEHDEYRVLYTKEVTTENQKEDRTNLDISHPTPKLKWWQKLIGGFKGRRY